MQFTYVDLLIVGAIVKNEAAEAAWHPGFARPARPVPN
jgi:hypothetical protein